MSWNFWQKKSIPCPRKVPTDITLESCSVQHIVIPPTEFVEKNDTIKDHHSLNACEKCGACCAFFPVNFPDIEKDDLINGTLLTKMSLPAGLMLRVMRGTECRTPRCKALEGEVGKRVRCLIYAGRPSTCRNFIRSWENDSGNTLCDRARAVYGMQPFSQY